MTKFIIKLGYTRKKPTVLNYSLFDTAEHDYNTVITTLQEKNRKRVKTVGLYQIHKGTEEFIREFKIQ